MRTEPTFRGDWQFMSNFYYVTVVFDGVEYVSVEHAYQASKFLDPEVRRKFQGHSLKPGEAKRLAKELQEHGLLRPDWWEVNIPIMEDLVRQKFRSVTLLRMLVGTGTVEIVEGNYWHDNFWGKCTCSKCKNKPQFNHLGKILMRIRREARGG
jgi:ribA/ribD-fused uncharacterized protein